jgi:hypothetical protein
MALSPNAPDYVSQVRGIIGDLRENYLKKQQLYQQNEQAQAQIGLGYAQLAAQRENSARQADLDSQRIQAASIDNERQLEQYRSGMMQKSFENDLAERKFNFERQKELIKAQEEERKRRQEENSSVMQNELETAYSSGDPYKIQEASLKASQTMQNTADYLKIAKAAKEAVNTQRAMEQENINLKTQDQAYAIASSPMSLNLETMTPTELDSATKDLTTSYSQLRNTDPTIRKMLQENINNARAAHAKLMSDEDASSMASLVQLGTFKSLGDGQEQFDKIMAKYPPEIRSTSPGYFEDMKNFALVYNKSKAIKALEKDDIAMHNLASALVKMYPDQAVQTEGGVTWSDPPPSLEEEIGDDGTINPRTGARTKASKKAVQEWFARNKLKLPNQSLFDQFLVQGAAAIPAPAGKTTSNTKQAAPPLNYVRTTPPVRAQTQVAQQPSAVTPTSTLSQQDQIALSRSPNSMVRDTKTGKTMSIKQYYDTYYAQTGGYNGLLSRKNKETTGSRVGNIAGKSE